MAAGIDAASMARRCQNILKRWSVFFSTHLAARAPPARAKRQTQNAKLKMPNAERKTQTEIASAGVMYYQR
jgi:hypothetical protein